MKLPKIKQFSVATIAALALTATVGGIAMAATCTNPTPDCPKVNCDK
jgi:hypothetical protein